MTAAEKRAIDKLWAGVDGMEEGSSKEYLRVGVKVAQIMLTARKKFSSWAMASCVFDSKLPPSVRESYVKEFLYAWQEGDRSGMSEGAEEILDALPSLPAKLKKYWAGV